MSSAWRHALPLAVRCLRLSMQQPASGVHFKRPVMRPVKAGIAQQFPLWIESMLRCPIKGGMPWLRRGVPLAPRCHARFGRLPPEQGRPALDWKSARQHSGLARPLAPRGRCPIQADSRSEGIPPSQRRSSERQPLKPSQCQTEPLPGGSSRPTPRGFLLCCGAGMGEFCWRQGKRQRSFRLWPQ